MTKGGFSGQVALVTGAGSGIGRALAEALAREGAIVAVTDVNEQNAGDVAGAITAAGGKATAFRLDVTDNEQWQSVADAVAQTLGPVDIFCSNAGAAGSRQQLTSIPIEFMRWLFDLNVVSALRGLHLLLPGMKERNRGRILFTGSMASLWTGGGGGDYSATKHALLAVADTLRQEVAALDIQVSLLCPAAVATNLAETTTSLAQSLGGITLEPGSPGSSADLAAITEATGGVLSPEETARIALDGLREGRFFLITHPKSGQRSYQRHAEIEAAIDLAAKTLG